MKVIFDGTQDTFQMRHGVHLVPGENEVPEEAGQAMVEAGLVHLPGAAPSAPEAGPVETTRRRRAEGKE